MKIMIARLLYRTLMVVTGTLALLTPAFGADVKIWDTGKTYTYNFYSFDAWQDRNTTPWTQVPYGVTTTYKFTGECVIEGENYWMWLHASAYNAVFLYAKIDEQGTPSRHNEMYRSYDTPSGYRAYSSGAQRNVVLKNQPGEVMVYSEGLPCTKPDGVWSVTSTYRALAGKQWLELRPVSQCSQQGMHGESRIHISPATGTGGADYVLDSMKTSINTTLYFPDAGTVLLDFIMDADILWTMNWKKAVAGRAISGACLGGNPAGWDRLGDDYPAVPNNPIFSAPFAQYDSSSMGLTGEPITIGVIYKSYWHFQHVNQAVTAGVAYNGTWSREYTGRLPYETTIPAVGTPWQPGYPGKYRITGCVGGNYYTNEVTIAAPSPGYAFTSPVSGTLEYLMIYMNEPTAGTPPGVLGVKGIYDEAIPAAIQHGTIAGTVTNAGGQPIAGAKVTNGAVTATTDSNGAYTLPDIPVGVYPFVITANGYVKIIRAVDVAAGATTSVNPQMEVDTQPPLIMSVLAANVTRNSCTITWNTDKAADSQVEYGVTSGYGQQSALSTSFTLNHSVNLTGLTEDTPYHFVVISRDTNGNLARSVDQTFSTQPPLDDSKPTWWSFYAGAGDGIWGRTNTQKHSGTFSAYLKATAYYSNSINIGIIAGKSNGYSGTEAYPIQPGTAYNYSFWIRGDVASVNPIAIVWNAGGTKSEIWLNSVAPTATWAQYSGTFTTKADTQKFVLIFKIYGVSSSENLGAIEVDDVSVSTADGMNLIQNPGAEAPFSTAPTATPTPFGGTAPDVPKVIVGPNPCRAGQESSAKVTFRNLPPNARIKIYSLSGKLIAGFECADEADGGAQDWDVSGIAGGVYMYSISYSGGVLKGKVSIVR